MGCGGSKPAEPPPKPPPKEMNVALLGLDGPGMRALNKEVQNMSNGEMSEDGSTVTFTVRGTTYATHILESGPTTSLANLLSSAGQSYSAAFVFASLSDRLFDASLTDGGDGLKEAYSLFGAATTSFKCVCLILNEAGFKEKLSSISFAHIQQSAPEVTHVIKKNFLRAASKDYPGGQPGIFVVDLTDPPKVKSVMNGALAVVMEHIWK